MWVFKVSINKLDHELGKLRQGDERQDFKTKLVLTIAKEKHIMFTEPIIPAVIILLEDGVEILLEYHWVDKYITKSDNTVLFNATIMAILDTGLFLLCLKSFYDQYHKCCVNRLWKLFTLYIVYYGHAFFFAIATIVRAYKVWYQTKYGEINPKCLKVKFERAYNRSTYKMEEKNGRLIQTPYGDGCLSQIDYLIIVMVCLSIIFGAINLVIFIYTRWTLNDNKYRQEVVIPFEEQVAEGIRTFLNKTETEDYPLLPVS